MNLARQFPFDFSPRPALGLEDFMVVPGNADAVAWLDRWPDWTGGMLVIYGDPGCGKTHLAHVWQSKSGAKIYQSVDLTEQTAWDWVQLAGKNPALVLEGADQGADEKALFHLHNLVVQENGSLLLTGGTAPARWSVALPDLASRLAALASVELAAPNDELFTALLIKQFADRQQKVSADVVTYLVTRMERSFNMARRIVRDLDQAALAGQREITKPLARQVLEKFQNQQVKD